jgi:hypothetical protein
VLAERGLPRAARHAGHELTGDVRRRLRLRPRGGRPPPRSPPPIPRRREELSPIHLDLAVAPPPGVTHALSPS